MFSGTKLKSSFPTPFSSIQSEISINLNSDLKPPKNPGLPKTKDHHDSFLDKENTSSIAFCIDEKGSLTDFTILHAELTNREKGGSPSRHDNLYEIIPPEYYTENQKMLKEALKSAKQGEFSFCRQSSTNFYVNKSGESYTGPLQDISNTYEDHHNHKVNTSVHGNNSIRTELFDITEETIVPDSKLSTADHFSMTAGSNKNHEPKKTTVNLMDLIKTYTGNPHIEEKIKQTKAQQIKRDKIDEEIKNAKILAENTFT